MENSLINQIKVWVPDDWDDYDETVDLIYTELKLRGVGDFEYVDPELISYVAVLLGICS